MAENIAIIFAGGSGMRMHTKTKPKQFLKMNGKPIIIHTLENFEFNSDISSIVVVCIEEWIDYLQKLLIQYNIKKVRKIVKGGNTGQSSIYNGLYAAYEISQDEETIVLIHDGVRPLITDEIISKNIEAVKKYGSAITVAPATETIIVSEDDRDIKDVMNRNNCYYAKAPQSFYLKDILLAHKKAKKEGMCDIVDSATLMRRYGHTLHIVEGNNENIKVTTPSDFYILRSLYEAKENMQLFGF